MPSLPFEHRQNTNVPGVQEPESQPGPASLVSVVQPPPAALLGPAAVLGSTSAERACGGVGAIAFRGAAGEDHGGEEHNRETGDETNG